MQVCARAVRARARARGMNIRVCGCGCARTEACSRLVALSALAASSVALLLTLQTSRMTLGRREQPSLVRSFRSHALSAPSFRTRGTRSSRPTSPGVWPGPWPWRVKSRKVPAVMFLMIRVVSSRSEASAQAHFAFRHLRHTGLDKQSRQHPRVPDTSSEGSPRWLRPQDRCATVRTWLWQHQAAWRAALSSAHRLDSPSTP